jgi:hypothetical protein
MWFAGDSLNRLKHLGLASAVLLCHILLHALDSSVIDRHITPLQR